MYWFDHSELTGASASTHLVASCRQALKILEIRDAGSFARVLLLGSIACDL